MAKQPKPPSKLMASFPGQRGIGPPLPNQVQGLTAVLLGGGPVPGQVTNAQVYASGMPGHVYVTGQLPPNNGSVITGFNGVLSPSGITGSSTVQTDPVNAPSVRVDFFSVPNGAQTGQIQAVSANGAGLLSLASANSVAPPQFTDTFQGNNATYIGWGGSQVGLSPRWNNTYFDFSAVRTVTPGQATVPNSFTPTVNAPAYPAGFGLTNQGLLEVTPTQNGGYAVLLNIWEDNPAANNNGAFFISPYQFLVFLIYRLTSASVFTSQPEFTANYEGVVTGVSGSTITDANQNWPPNAWPAGSSASFNRNSGAASAYSSNTVNTFQATGTWSQGDHYYIQTGDKLYGNQISNIAQYCTGPNAGTIPPNQWNVIKIPISALGIGGLNNNLFYKIGIGTTNPGTDVFWLSCPGWSVA